MTEPQDRESLRDLDGIRVSVDELTPASLARGLSREGLRRLVEERLARAGVKVLGIGDFPTGDPFLRVRVATSPERGGLVGCHVEVDVVQIVFMRRNPLVTFNRAQTWKAADRMDVVPATRLAAVVQRDVARQVDEFLAAYGAVNASR